MRTALASDFFCVRQKAIDLMENFKDHLHGNLFALFKNCLDSPKYSIRQNYVFFLKVRSPEVPVGFCRAKAGRNRGRAVPAAG